MISGGKLPMLKEVGIIMTVALVMLATIGVFFIYSATYANEDLPGRMLWVRQVAWIMIGIGVYLLMAVADYRAIGKYASWLYAGSVFLLVMVLLVGATINNAKSWFVFFGINLQPSEPAKLATIILLARHMSLVEFDGSRIRALIAPAVIALAPFALVMKQPDVGTAMIFVPVALCMMFAAGISFRYFAVAAVTVLVLLSLLVGILVIPEKLGLGVESREKIMKVTGLSEYQKKRIYVFLGIIADPRGAEWNKIQSKIAVGSGGVTGKGFTKGTQNILGFLPRSVAPTDFIYSVIAEEKGFVGSMAVLFLFAVVITAGTVAAMSAVDKFGQLLCVGITTLIFSHVFINIGMTIGLLPITGLPLPLLSYGGSFTVAVMAGLGIMQSVQIRSRRPFEY